jgi:hypothetical protein
MRAISELAGIVRFAICLLSSVVVLTGRAIAAPATHLVLSNDNCLIQACPQPLPTPIPVVSSGEPFGVYAAALDAGNSRDILYAGTVSFSSSDSAAILPSLYTFVPVDEGGKAFTVILRTTGQQTITVADISGSPTSGTLIMTVTGDASPSAEVPTLTPWMLIVLALLLGSAGLWVSRSLK